MLKAIVCLIVSLVAVPVLANQIVVNRAARTLTFTDEAGETKTYSIVVGKRVTPTPAGEYEVVSIDFDPTWYIPLSIQEERMRKGLPALTSLPPGRNNPLGRVMMKLDRFSIGIHGNSMRRFRPGAFSHGCIRMSNRDAVELANMIDIGTSVRID